MRKKSSRSKVLRFRLTPTEEELVSKWAMESGLELPEYLRRVAMQGTVFEVLVAKSVRIETVEDEGQMRRHAG